MKALIIALIVLLWFYPVKAQECIQEPVQLIGVGQAVTFFEPGLAYDVVRFEQPMDELVFFVLNASYEYELIHQDTNGFTVKIFLGQSNPFDSTDYTYLAGGYRCAPIYRVMIPMIIQ